MYGYVNIDKGELKVKEYYEFRTFYCGLCHELLRKAGPAGQLTLSYDMTVLTVVLTSLYEPDVITDNLACVAHPVKKKPVIISPYTGYAADMNLLLFMKHAKDDWRDDKKITSKAAYTYLREVCRKIYVAYPRQWTAIENELHALDLMENRHEYDVEKAAGHFGRLFGEVYACKNDIFKDDLRLVGFNLGKFVYICDAYEDIYKDEKSGNYNPFHDIYKDNGFDDKVKEMLTMCMAMCTEALERLPLVKDESIIRNIFYSGVFKKFDKIYNERQENR
ncbi:MAG: DUF5685 family protein [Catonella sp.]|nr:DUF5685 family protein [Catonella sp.]MDY6356086.1 DUF5685 family protein [Catonella sp.]